ncbi:universal stress protein [Halorussus aquaticus]|uniref:Universal stress protein n=1 Tax=Halorussus aquaticus TaxID=2953748 RepID=A0ABD5PXR1_9EURY|nr:universal stress protein [Halorussus aquaticus]
MTRVVVPVRYPLTDHSERTLSEAVRIAEDRDAALTVLHVNLYHHGGEVSRADLKRAVEAEFGRVPNAMYVVRDGFLVEETILEEVAAEEADVVVIGHKQAGRWRRALRKLTADPGVEAYLREKLDAEIVTVGRD